MHTMKEILKAVLFVILILGLGAASTAVGLLAQESPEEICVLSAGWNQEKQEDTNGSVTLCNLGLAGYIIGTIGLAFATVIELIGYASGRSTTCCAKIFEILMLVVAFAFLITGGITVAVGWAKTCNTFSHVVLRPPYENDILDCSAYYDGIIDIKKIVGSAACAFFGAIMTIIAVSIAGIKLRETDEPDKQPILN